MFNMMNRVNLIGRLTKDPELRYTPNGVAVCTFTLAVTRTYANADNVREADFIPIVVWRKAAENAANYLKKGSLAGVDGRLQTRSYDGQDGKRVYVTEVVADTVDFLSPSNSSKNNEGTQQGQSQQNPYQQQTQQNPYQQHSQQQNPFQRQSQQQFQQNPYQQQSQRNYSFQQSQQGYNFNNDPFADDDFPIDISDDELPF